MRKLKFKLGDRVQVIMSCSIKERRGMKGKIVQIWANCPYQYFVKFRTKKVWFVEKELVNLGA